MFKEFREFAMRGNVVDLAVGVIIGAAFGTVVNSLVNDVIMPPIGLILGGVDFSSLFVVLKQGTKAAGPYMPAGGSKARRRGHGQHRRLHQRAHQLRHRRVCGFPARQGSKRCAAPDAGSAGRRRSDAAGKAPDGDPRSDEGARLGRTPRHRRGTNERADWRATTRARGNEECGSARASRIAAAFSRPNATIQSSDACASAARVKVTRSGGGFGASCTPIGPQRLLDRAMDAVGRSMRRGRRAPRPGSRYRGAAACRARRPVQSASPLPSGRRPRRMAAR